MLFVSRFFRYWVKNGWLQAERIYGRILSLVKGPHRIDSVLYPFLPVPIIQRLPLGSNCNVHVAAPFGVKMLDEMDIRIK